MLKVERASALSAEEFDLCFGNPEAPCRLTLSGRLGFLLARLTESPEPAARERATILDRALTAYVGTLRGYQFLTPPPALTRAIETAVRCRQLR